MYKTKLTQEAVGWQCLALYFYFWGLEFDYLESGELFLVADITWILFCLLCLPVLFGFSIVSSRDPR